MQLTGKYWSGRIFGHSNWIPTRDFYRFLWSLFSLGRKEKISVFELLSLQLVAATEEKDSQKFLFSLFRIRFDVHFLATLDNWSIDKRKQILFFSPHQPSHHVDSEEQSSRLFCCSEYHVGPLLHRQCLWGISLWHCGAPHERGVFESILRAVWY